MGLAGSNRRGDHSPRASRSLNGAGRPGKSSHGAVPIPAGKLVFTIPSDHNRSQEIQQQILKALQTHGFNGHSFFAVKLALEEAMVNAIKHGNRQDPRKKVHIEARVSARQVQISIEDEGPGFDRHCVPDPTADENLEKCSGRGILLIESYMNRVRWERGGRRLIMVKDCENDAC